MPGADKPRPQRTRDPVFETSHLSLSAKIVEIAGPRAVVEGRFESAGEVCATCRGAFVGVGPGHPAYHFC